MITCINCGDSDDRYDYLCHDCYLKTHYPIDSRVRLKLSICKQCFATLVKDVWRDSPLEANIDNNFIQAISDVIILRYKIKSLRNFKISIKMDMNFTSVIEMPDIVTGTFSISGNPDAFLPEINLDEQFSVYLRYRRCHRCASLETTGAIVLKIQIRGAERQLNEIANVAKNLFQDLKEYPITEETFKDGWDLSFHDDAARAGLNLVENLKINYGTLIIKTKETTGYDRLKSKSKTRDVISIRLSPFLPGDILIKEDLPYQTLSIVGKTIVIYDFFQKIEQHWNRELMWGKKLRIFLPYEELPIFQLITIEPNTNSMQFMNLSSYEIFEVALINRESLKEGTEIRGFVWENQLYISQV